MSQILLIVDDEESILHALKRATIEEDFAVLPAHGAEEALDLLCKNTVDVLLTDNKMPGMSGMELLEKAKGLSPETVRIMMTGYADLATAIQAINAGEVYKFIVKPWKNEELLAILRAAMERSHLVKSLKRSDKTTLLSLAQTIELKDHYTKGHCERVARYAMEMAVHFPLTDLERENIQYGSWLHDCGKIGVSGTILNKPGPLDDAEWGIMKKHPGWGAEVVQLAQLDTAIVNIVLHHHENYDGTGYPAGLAGDAIPFEARLVAVADVFDALVTDRPYRKGFSVKEACSIIASERGKHLDPVLVDLFLRKKIELATVFG